MRLFPKVLLRWREPKALRVAGYKEGKRSLARIIPIVLLLSLVLIWITSIFAAEAVWRLCLALGLLILFMYGILWAYRVFPSWVQITEKGISQSVTDDEERWKFKSIEHCEIATTHVEGRMVRMLIVETKKGKRSMVGIADSVSTEELQATLQRAGMKVITIAEPVDSGDGSQAWQNRPPTL